MLRHHLGVLAILMRAWSWISGGRELGFEARGPAELGMLRGDPAVGTSSGVHGTCRGCPGRAVPWHRPRPAHSQPPVRAPQALRPTSPVHKGTTNLPVTPAASRRAARRSDNEQFLRLSPLPAVACWWPWDIFPGLPLPMGLRGLTHPCWAGRASPHGYSCSRAKITGSVFGFVYKHGAALCLSLTCSAVPGPRPAPASR